MWNFIDDIQILNPISLIDLISARYEWSLGNNINEIVFNHLFSVKRKGLLKAPFNELMLIHYLTSNAFWLVTISPA